MGVLWRAGAPASVRAVADELKEGRSAPLADRTVMTVRSGLAGLGLLVREQGGSGFVYIPAAADTAEIAVRGVLGEFGGGARTRSADGVEPELPLRARVRRLMRGGS